MNGLRPLIRLAWREVTGNKARTALVVGLVALMVGAAVTAGTIVRTVEPTDEEILQSEFGSADVILQVETNPGEPGASVATVDGSDPEPLTDDETNRLFEAAEDILGGPGVIAQSTFIGGRNTTEPFSTASTRQLNVAGLDLTESVFDTRYQLLEGRLPEARNEVVLTPQALTNFAATVGEAVLISDQEFVIVGEVSRATFPFRGVAVMSPEAFGALGFDPSEVGVEVLFSDGDPGPAVFEIEDQIRARADVPFDSFRISSRANESQFFRGPPEGIINPNQPEQLSTLVAALFAVQVALVAAAAFAVGVARKTRQFGQLQATGANNVQLRSIVLIQAGLTGLVGALVGAGLGVAVAFFVWSQGWLDTAGNRFPVDVRFSVLDIAGPLIVGVGAAVAAAWWPTRRLRNLDPAAALADHVPISKPRVAAPLWGLVVLTGGTLLLVATAGTDFFFDSGDLGPALVVVAVLAMFGGALTSIGFLIHKVGERADRFGLLTRIVARSSARHQTRSWVAVAALVAVVILPVVMGASAKAYPGSFASGVEDNSWVSVNLRANDEPIEGTTGFFRQVGERVDSELSPNALFTVSSARSSGRNLHSSPFFIQPTESGQILRSTGSLETVRGTQGVLDAVGLDPNLWSTPDAPEAVIAFGERDRTSASDVLLTTGTESVSFQVVEDVEFLDYESWVLVSPETEDRFDLRMVPTSVFVDFGSSPTDDDEAELAGIANAAWQDTIGDVPLVEASAWIDTNSGLDGPTGTQFAWLAIGGFTALAILVSLVTSSLAAVEVDKEISTMIAAGAPPSMRRRLLGAQTTYHLFIAAVVGVPLALLIFWAATRADDFGPRGPTFPWTSMAVMGLVVPVVVGLAVAAIFRNGRPAVSRRI